MRIDAGFQFFLSASVKTSSSSLISFEKVVSTLTRLFGVVSPPPVLPFFESGKSPFASVVLSILSSDVDRKESDKVEQSRVGNGR